MGNWILQYNILSIDHNLIMAEPMALDIQIDVPQHRATDLPNKF